MGEVTLTKEVAAALEAALKRSSTSMRGNSFDTKCAKSNVLQSHARSSVSWTGETAALNGVPFDTIATALYVGYEIEKPPVPPEHVKIGALFNVASVNYHTEKYGSRAEGEYYGEMGGIEKTCEALGINLTAARRAAADQRK